MPMEAKAVCLNDRQSAYIGDIARRLLDKGRVSKALEWLDREMSETVGDRDTAQSLRWKVFQERLSLPHW